ncbi:MAG: hypothetical protein AAB538_03820, partial [Patescibacteria group bacterium]
MKITFLKHDHAKIRPQVVMVAVVLAVASIAFHRVAYLQASTPTPSPGGETVSPTASPTAPANFVCRCLCATEDDYRLCAVPRKLFNVCEDWNFDIAVSANDDC